MSSSPGLQYKLQAHLYKKTSLYFISTLIAVFKAIAGAGPVTHFHSLLSVVVGEVADVCETRTRILVAFCKFISPKTPSPVFISHHRLVSRLPAGVGSFPQAGHPQHADELPGVVAL